MQARAGAKVPAQDGDRGIGDEEEQQRRDEFAEPVQQRYQQEDGGAGQVHHGDPQHVLPHDDALYTEEGADRCTDAGRDGQDAQATGRSFGMVTRAGTHAAFQRHLRHADRSYLERHGPSVSPRRVPSQPTFVQRLEARSASHSSWRSWAESIRLPVSRSTASMRLPHGVPVHAQGARRGSPVPVVLEERGEPAQELGGPVGRVERSEHRFGIGLKWLGTNGVEQR